MTLFEESQSDRLKRVLYLTTGLSRVAGGPYFSVSELARAVQANPRWSTTILGVVRSPSEWSQDQAQWHGLDVRTVEGGTFVRSCKLATRLEAATQANVCLVHASGLWDSASVSLRLAGDKIDVPLVLSPRGMLEPWALQYHRCRKRVALLLWQDRVLRRVTMFHATSQGEVESIRRLGLRQPIALIPNGIVPPKLAEKAVEPGAVRRCVFLSRLHPKKGIPLLLRAWQSVRPAGWELLIAGYGDRRHVQEIEETLASSNLCSVKLVGELRGREKWAFLGNADLFVLPSHSENFGLAVAEAMAAGLPVITTTATPWQVLKERSLGWWVPPTVASISEALLEATRLDVTVLRHRGKQSSDYIRRHYDWQQIGQRMTACYRWVLGEGNLPAEVVVE